MIHNDDAYHLDGYTYCRDCYDEERDRYSNIHDYSYKPEPIFYGNSKRYFGVELEIDGGGKEDEYAEEILDIANTVDEYIYIKSDGSLDDGMEIVSHPMSLEFHKDFCWEDIMRKAVRLGYRSHQTSTCGLHIHAKTVSVIMGHYSVSLTIPVPNSNTKPMQYLPTFIMNTISEAL